MYQYQETNGKRTGQIHTPHGIIHLPAFFPVTTFGDKYPLDRLVQPYLKRMSDCIMVSHYYAKQMRNRPALPLFIDSGGFAGLFDGSKIAEQGEYACIRTKEGDLLHPLEILRFQEAHGDLGATLDFPISPGMEEAEAKRRRHLTIQNALYAKKNQKNPDFMLYASLQSFDEDSARDCARIYARAGFSGIAIGGMVPRAKDPDYIKRTVRAIREEAPHCAIHVFGCGNTALIPELVRLGADSFDSSSYIRSAADTRRMENTAGLHAGLYHALTQLHQRNAAVSMNQMALTEVIPNIRLFH